MKFDAPRGRGAEGSAPNVIEPGGTPQKSGGWRPSATRAPADEEQSGPGNNKDASNEHGRSRLIKKNKTSPAVESKKFVKSLVRRGKLVGQARAIKFGTWQAATQISGFRVERYDGRGNRLAPVPVEIQRGMKNFISEGDMVQVKGTWRGKRPVRARKITNLTTNTIVFKRRAWLRALVFSLIALGAITAIVLVINA